MEEKVKHCKHPLKQCIFGDSDDDVVCQLGTEHIGQVIQASLAFHLYAER